MNSVIDGLMPSQRFMLAHYHRMIAQVYRSGLEHFPNAAFEDAAKINELTAATFLKYINEPMSKQS